MGIKINVLKCTGCMACEMACSYHFDDGFALLSSCIVPYRTREKKDYFGVLLKQEDQLVIARPEKLEIRKLSDAQESKSDSKGDSSAKPMLLREPCDLCKDIDEGPMCVKFCPAGALSVD